MSEVIGKIKAIDATQQVSASFKKRQLVVETDSNFPQFIPIEFKQDKTDLLNSYKVGDSVKVSINLTGREWINPQGEKRYFLGCEGWRIEKTADAPSPSQAYEESHKAVIVPLDDDDSGLPF